MGEHETFARTVHFLRRGDSFGVCTVGNSRDLSRQHIVTTKMTICTHTGVGGGHVTGAESHGNDRKCGAGKL